MVIKSALKVTETTCALFQESIESNITQLWRRATEVAVVMLKKFCYHAKGMNEISMFGSK
jgi:hypothetical protein